jgi:hypothetical protein
LQSVTFTKPISSSDTSGDFTFTPNSTFTFLADTRYWLSVGSSSGVFVWNGSVPPNGTPPTGISGIGFNGYQLSFDSGTSYSLTSQYSTFQINATQVTATAVPEPTSTGSYVALLAGLVASRKLLKSRAMKEKLD